LSTLKRLVIVIGLVLELFCFSSLAGVSGAFDSSLSARTKYNFNSGWKLLVGDPKGAEAPTFDDSGWKKIALPHAWNEDSAFKVSIHDLPTGIAWYRKRFRIPAGSSGKKVFLEFEGIRQGGEFFLNGKLIGRHENGVMAFGFDITNRRRILRFSGTIGISTLTMAASTRMFTCT